jgi:hypothetical protein
MEKNSTLIFIKETLNDDGMISLDDNEKSNINIIIDEIETNIDNSLLLACNDDAKVLVCDTIKRVCECV